MPAAFNLGRDASLTIVANGVTLTPIGLTNFTASQQTDDVKSRPLDGPPIHAYIPTGWTGTFEYDRSDAVLDDYFAASEDAYYNGTNTVPITIQQNVRDPNGGPAAVYRFTGVVLKLAEAGGYKADERVTQRVEYMATRRRKVS